MKKSFFDIAIFWQLILAISLVVLLGTFASVIGLLGMANTKTLLQELYQGNVKVVLKQSQLDGLYTEHHLTMLQHLGSESARKMHEYEQQAHGTEHEIKQLMGTISHSSGNYGAVASELQRLTQSYFDIAGNVLKLSSEFEKEDASRIMRSDLRDILLQVNSVAKQVVSQQTIAMEQFYNEAVQLQKRNSMLAWSFIVSAFLLSILLAYCIAKIIAHRLKILVKCAESLGKGDFEVRVDLQSDDEFGELAKSINIMALKLDTMFTELQGTYQVLEKKHTTLSMTSELEQSRLAQATVILQDIMQKVVDEQDTSIRYENNALLPCWEQKECPNKTCISYGNRDALRCWEVEDTLCPSGQYLSFAQKIKKCRNCQVYKNARSDSITTILETFNEMMAILDEKLKELSESRRLAEQSSMAKSEFLANMSHEIRTPMNGIIGFTELLLRMEIPAEQQDYLKMIQESSKRLMTLINDILDFSKIEAQKLELDYVDFNLQTLMNDTMKFLAVNAAEKGLELIVSISHGVPAYLCGDPGRLRQILINLVGNAIKFTEQGEICVSVDCDEEKAPEAQAPSSLLLRFSVQDTGIGIPAESQKTVFDLFTQADGSTTRKYGGTGLGLTISARLVEMMGGTIWLESEYKKGTTFYFTVRFDPTLGDKSSLLPVSCQELSEMSVLIVDDNATNLQVLSEMLCDSIQESELAHGGAMALEKIRSRNFDLLIIDAQMPEMDGFSLAQRIRALPGKNALPIILLTSAGQAGDAAHCKEIGINGYLMKPVVLPELLQAMKTVVGQEKMKTAESQAPLITRHFLRETPKEMRVLVVDDEPINQMLALSLLENNNCAVTVAANGKEAVDISLEQAFDCILMDIQMPVMDGVDATVALREMEKKRGKRTPIIAITAHAMKGDKEKFLDAGMDGYISKPMQIDALMSEITRLCKKTG